MTDYERRLDLRITISGSVDDPTADIKAIGEFDRLQVEWFDRATAVMPEGLVCLTVDLCETTIIDSAALGSLVRLRHNLDEIGAALTVVVDKSFQVTVMRVGGLVDFLGVTAVEHHSRASRHG